jgi:hypothetical protein
MKGPGSSQLDRLRIGGFLTPRLWLVLGCLVLVALALLPLAKRVRGGDAVEPGPSRQPSQQVEVPDRPPVTVPERAAPADVADFVPPAAPGSLQEARAYQLVLTGATCRLQDIQELRGDFKRLRAVRHAPGMISCRLLDAGGRLLAEETMPAPDEPCLVLDPNVPGPKGEPTLAKLAPGGETVFQTRLPKVAGAVTLEVLRLSGGNGAAPDARPPGELLASIRLPQS